jgi:hypothetical protein
MTRMMMKLLGFLSPQFGGSSGGGGGVPAKQDITTSNIAPWAQKGVESLIQSGMQNVYPNMKANYDEQGNVSSYDLGNQSGYTPFNANNTTGASGQALEASKSTTAGFTPLQQTAFQGAQNLQTPGQFGQATGMTGMAGMGSLQAGQNFQNMATNPYAQQAYMNPYIQNALTPQLEEMQRQYGITGTQEASKATQQGAFGGGREALVQAENNRNKNMAMNQAIGQGYNTAFNNAQQQVNAGVQLGLQGYGQANQAGSNLANIGGQQLQAQQSILSSQAQLGGQQQANQQAMLDRAS